MNSKAQLGDQLMIFTFLFLLIVIGTGIVLGTYMFFGDEYDFRKTDADLLNFKFSNCLEEQEINFQQTNDEIEKELFQKCALNQEVIKKHFTIQISINNEQKYKLNDATLCYLSEKNQDFPKCTETTITKNSNEIKVLTGSNQHSTKQIA